MKKKAYIDLVFGYWNSGDDKSLYLKDFPTEDSLLDWASSCYADMDKTITIDAMDYIRDVYGEKRCIEKIFKEYPTLLDIYGDSEHYKFFWYLRDMNSHTGPKGYDFDRDEPEPTDWIN